MPTSSMLLKTGKMEFSPGKKGEESASNKIPQEKNSQLKKHIESFPGIDSHYCTKGTDKIYHKMCVCVGGGVITMCVTTICVMLLAKYTLLLSE